MTIGRVNPSYRLEEQGITGLGNVYYNLIEMVMGSRVDGNLVHVPQGKSSRTADAATAEAAPEAGSSESSGTTDGPEPRTKTARTVTAVSGNS